ncbi:unnamed protein product [Oikopleura dioica]|uniref:Pan3 C-terminal knob domain-containing protein n=1 Tax=Oikopleura dioica TaxID=34765 RepID=E4XG62_OIKDI|nr:unnamed protein product [Oikopleura dioica]
MTFDYGEAASNNAPYYNLQSEIRGLNGQQQSQFPKMEFLPGTRFPGGKIGPGGQMIPQPTAPSYNIPNSHPSTSPVYSSASLDSFYSHSKKCLVMENNFNNMMQNNLMPQNLHQHGPASHLQAAFNPHQHPTSHAHPLQTQNNRSIQNLNDGTQLYNSMMYDYNGADYNYIRPPPQPQRPSFFMDEDIRERLLNQQFLCQLTLHESGDELRLPREVNTYHLTEKGNFLTNSYHELFPLKKEQKSSTLHPMVTSLFQSTHVQIYQDLGNKRLTNGRNIKHANIVRLHEVFTSKAFQDNSLLLIYDFHPGAESALDLFFRHSHHMSPKHKPLLKESVIWSIIIQITSALRTIHAHGLAYRCLELSKIIFIGKKRVKLAGIAVTDLLQGTGESLARNQQRDLTSLGYIILCLTSNNIIKGHHDQIGKVLDFVSKKYSKDLHSLISQLVMGGAGMPVNRRIRNINDLMPLIGARFYTMVDDALVRGDEIENQLSLTLENGRLFRLICKLGVSDRGEYGQYETGDRYLLKLFRNYLYHQVGPNGTPFMDLFHVISCLNKLDSASSERFVMNSRDNENVLVVSYADIHYALQKMLPRATHPPS